MATPDLKSLDIPGSLQAPHLVVLVHGLWGNPSHMNSIAEQLRLKHSPSTLRILIASTNTGYTTYDGVELGGERVAAEIEAELALMRADGGNPVRFSILGYSLGGLVARYCIGLLYARGIFSTSTSPSQGQLVPVNFATFASPWLGVRAPVRWFGTGVWNFLGSRTLSTSGQQMFLTDSFRESGRPLLSIMADPSSIFYRALGSFQHRVVYCNIIGDRSTPFYTTSISAVDPFVDLPTVKDSLTYVPGYAPNVISVSSALTPKVSQRTDVYSRVVDTGHAWLTRLPLVAALFTLLPITSTIFLANAGYQTLHSSRRIRAHEASRKGSKFEGYKVPFLLEQALEQADGVVSQAPEYLSNEEAAEVANRNQASSTTGAEFVTPGSTTAASSETTLASNGHAQSSEQEKVSNATLARQLSGFDTDTPTLALAPAQFDMIRSLNRLGFKKYPVHITLVTHSHAAIVVRWKKDGFKEGYVVIRHWVEEEFEV